MQLSHRAIFTASLFALALGACASSEETPPPDAAIADAGNGQPDTGVIGTPDTGVVGEPDTGVGAPDTGAPDTGEPDTGAPDTGAPDTGVPDTGTPDAGPPPQIQVSGQLRKLGEYLAGTTVGVGQASLLTYGVYPPQTALTQDAPNAGLYTISAPPNGQLVLFSNKVGYFPSYNAVTTQSVDLTNKNLYIAESAWLSGIATAFNVNIQTPFACHAPALDPTQQCIYTAIVGRILDDGTAGAGTVRPVAGILKTDFTIAAGPAASDQWYKKGPYFLTHTGTAAVGVNESIVDDDNGTYKGGLFVTFLEIPQTIGPESLSVHLSIRHDLGGGVYRYFGPIDLQVFRPYGVSWTTVPETGAPPPPPPPNAVDFDTQIYPLFLPVTQGGLGCQGCHTNQGGATPSGGLNLYGGAAAAFASLDPAVYPARVNLTTPAASYLLVRPLYEATGTQDHPIFAFVSDQDPAYQLIYAWIQGGATRNVAIPQVSFANEIRPLLYNTVANGGMGCRTCHYDGVDATTAPGGFYMGGGAPGLYAELTAEAPLSAGATAEQYRVNKTAGQTDRSLVLTNPLFGNPEPHPVKIFSSNADPRYQLIYRWISEGYQNN